jgi:uncharacterized membrane protein
MILVGINWQQYMGTKIQKKPISISTFFFLTTNILLLIIRLLYKTKQKSIKEKLQDKNAV